MKTTEGKVTAIAQDGDVRRVYSDGPLPRAMLATQLDEGFALTGHYRTGLTNDGHVAHFRRATPEEVAECRRLMADAAAKEAARNA